MSLQKLNTVIMAAAMILAAVSCKDKESDTVAPSMRGALKISAPAFVGPKAVVNMTQRGVTHPEGEGIGYFWRISPEMKKNDTVRFENGLDPDGKKSDGNYTYQFPDSLGTYTVLCGAYAEGYSTSSGSLYIEVVKGGVDGSITGIDFSDGETVTIGGRTYQIAKIGGTEWLRRNVAEESCGLPYQNCKAMSDVLGRYYSWEEAVKVCPEGWRLPSEEDWTELAKAAGAKDPQKFEPARGIAAALMGNAEFNGKRLWEYWPAVGDITDAAKTSMIPAGFVSLGSRSDDRKDDRYREFTYSKADFKGIREYAVFWTSDKVEGDDSKAYYRYLIADMPDLMVGSGDISTFGASVRCVRTAAAEEAE